jgi:hypothetical protein
LGTVRASGACGSVGLLLFFVWSFAGGSDVHEFVQEIEPEGGAE